MIKSSVLLSALAAALSWVGGAQAAMLSYDASYGPQRTDWAAPGQVLSLQKFNPLLGTLNAVTINWRGSLGTTFLAFNAGTATTVVDYLAFGDMSFSFPVLGVAQLVFGPKTGQMSLVPAEQESVVVDLLKDGTDTLATNLSDFIGSGGFDVRVLANSESTMTENSGNVDTRVRTNASAYAQVVYDYTPSPRATVPEPASLALLGLALTASAAASRRRR